MSRDAPLKAERDYSEILKEEFVKIDILLASNDDYSEPLNQLLTWEKKTRQAADLGSSKQVLSKIVDMLVSKGQWDELDEQLTLLSKKHGQLLKIKYLLKWKEPV